jgi:hypothetical protein
MAKIKIDAEIFASISNEGIHSSLFVGDAGDPAIEETVSWEEILEQEIELGVIPNSDKPFVVDFDEQNDAVAEAMMMVKTFRDLADRLEAKIMERPVFLRHCWKQGDKLGVPSDIKDYYVTFEDYLQEKLNDTES